MDRPAIPAMLTFNTSALLEEIRRIYPDEFKSIMAFVVMAVQLGAMNAAHTSDAKRTMEHLAAYPDFDATNSAEFGKFHRHVTGLTLTSTRNMITYNLITIIKLQLERLAPGLSESVVSKFVTTSLTPESAMMCQEVIWRAYNLDGRPALRDSLPPPPPLIPIPRTVNASSQSPARPPLAHRPLKRKSDEPAEQPAARRAPTPPANPTGAVFAPPQPLEFRAPPARDRIIMVPIGSGSGSSSGSSSGHASKPIYEYPAKN